MSLTPADNAETLPKAGAPITKSEDQPAGHLPRIPVVVIEPRSSWMSISLRELFRSHELLYFLIWRDIKVRYKQTLLGVVWAILQPVCMMVIFALFFGKMIHVPSDGVPYPLFAFAGLLPWLFFSTAVTTSGNSMVNSANLITKVYFPRLLVPVASVGAALLDFAITFVVLGLLLAYYRVEPTSDLLMLPLFIALLIVLATACGVLISAVNVKYRDVRILLPFLIQIWFFASPIIYPSSIVPDRWRWILSLNPMTGIIDGFRVALFGHRPFNWPALIVSTVFTFVLLVCALITFSRMERSFADVV